MLIRLALAVAIQASNPSVPSETARTYATWVTHEAEEHHLDPWIFQAIIHRETRWTPGLTRHEVDGSCSVGLGQINVPCNNPRAKKLLDPHENIKRMADFLDGAKRECRTDCVNLGWLRAYNPGSHDYFVAIRDDVRRHHAQSRKSALLPVPARMHVAEMPREEGR